MTLARIGVGTIVSLIPAQSPFLWCGPDLVSMLCLNLNMVLLSPEQVSMSTNSARKQARCCRQTTAIGRRSADAARLPIHSASTPTLAWWGPDVVSCFIPGCCASGALPTLNAYQSQSRGLHSTNGPGQLLKVLTWSCSFLHGWVQLACTLRDTCLRGCVFIFLNCLFFPASGLRQRRQKEWSVLSRKAPLNRTADLERCLQVVSAQALLVHAARLLDTAFAGHPTALLYFVMVMCPLFMNLTQVRIFLLLPQIKKHTKHPTRLLPRGCRRQHKEHKDPSKPVMALDHHASSCCR